MRRGASDLFTIGTRAVIRKVARRENGPDGMLVLGMERVVIVKVDEEDGHMTARVRPLPIARRFQPRDRSADAVDCRDGHRSSWG